MRPPVRSKKMALFAALPEARRHSWTELSENGPHRSDGKPQIPAGPTRTDGRTGRRRPASRLWPAAGPAQARCCAGAAGQEPRPLRSARAAPETPIWSLRVAGAQVQARRHRWTSPSPTSCRCLRSSIGGVWTAPPAAEPLTARAPLASGARETLQLPLRHAGTLLCDLGLLGDGQARPSRARALVVRESEPVAVDRDEVFLIEEWRLRAGRNRDRAGRRPRGYRAGFDGQWPAFPRYYSANQ